ncbi:MAG: hypothetical protein PF442_02855 [Desulfobulbaceae bacterium]|jgi:hypothetical protein|nr:hypothetical protein [Desulfobulbaceae bacterium]
MATAKEHMAADLAYALADTDEAAEEFTWDGETFTGSIDKSDQGDLDHYDSLAVARCSVTVATGLFPVPFPGSLYEFNDGQWLVDDVKKLPGAVCVKLSRNIA